jgi:hypothetical protein
MQRPKKAAESRERTVIKNASKPIDSPKDFKYRSYSQVKSLIRKRMVESPGVFESHKLGRVMKCVFCMKVINPKKSNVEEHLKTIGHRDAVANLTIEGKIM